MKTVGCMKIIGVLGALSALSCSQMGTQQQASAAPERSAQNAAQVSTQPAADTSAVEAAEPSVPLKEIYEGSGNLINYHIANNTMPNDTEGEVTLNFQNSEISEVVKTVLGDIMGVNYAMSQAVTGTVSMRTTRPISRDSLIPVLENLLSMNNAALIKGQDFYEIVPTGEGGVTGLTPSTKLNADRGYQVLIAPLRYIGAKEMVKILEPVKSTKAVVKADPSRNMLIMAGTHSDLYNLRQTIQIFDVDQLKGMSVGLFRMQNVDASTMQTELEQIFGDSAEGPLAGLVRFTMIERLNALLVITPQKKYLSDVETWIERLDQAQNPHGANMYVYYVQHARADNLADLLNQLFEGGRRNAVAAAQREAARPQPNAEGDGAAEQGDRQNQQLSSVELGEVTIIPDLESNSLLIMATPSDYEEIEKAITKLDVQPLQVLVEASIVEVTLDEGLEYGLQWFFKNSFDDKTGRGGLNIPANGRVVTRDSDGNIVSTLNGVLDDPVDFTYAVFDAVGTRAVLNAIAGDSRLNVLSSPSLMVLDNHQALITVGDRVPIRTSETSNTSSTTNINDNIGLNVTSQIQYQDTGVTLEVTPRVNAGGMVVLDITQKVDDVSTTTSSNIDSPTILKREINTNVAVQSGETIVLGGLIREDKKVSENGVPFLKDIPGLGLLFSSKSTTKSKTELVVMITPTAISNPKEARDVTEEYKAKLKDVDLSSLK
ncbi:type II secretion system secretin GspD [Porticoccaceae bacterium LTM1]|nr:type II secretion system secretin GspD [Porticoccaceae bacterium LTM1]